MITVELKGHTGNNMFQISAAIGLAKINSTSSGYVGGNDKVIPFKLDGISLNTNASKKLFDEQSFSFYNKFNLLKDNTHLRGYFQSYKYFTNANDEVKTAFTFKDYLYPELYGIDNFRYEGLLEEKNLTGLHVRRGDYLNYPDIYPRIELGYYFNCLEKIKNREIILIFSDDIQWCREKFIGNRYLFVTAPPAHSLLLMSQCDNLIISNSTFSWWGAWLGKNKRVFRPSVWFGSKWPYNSSHASEADCTKDLCPKHWEIMQRC